MKSVIHHNFQKYNKELNEIIDSFDLEGRVYGNQDRNQLKLFELEDFTINIKSFKTPNFFNQVVYRLFRKSKAKRSYEHGLKLSELGIGTPSPIAFYEFPKKLLFKSSFYISLHIKYDLTFRELTHDLNYPDHETILRAFTRYTYKLHENNILFLDHSPGNTLIKKIEDGYAFYLVDLNRMVFKPLNFKDRIENFRRLTVHRSMIETMSDEYARISGFDYNQIVDMMWSSTEEFQKKFHRKRRLKKRLKLES
ncbi:MAG: Kdo domain containing protein [Flavobacteriaceae bacterium]|nr:lipopolysaccharide kinase InaA family protein [Bacteroidia bacterium]MBT8287361.1 lipopolysaccharide kinase InaA family protein [Bacteroidia bacterium]NNF75016.1 Kdo domain containing protein [Flavobacteriaceae bacterium]NNK73677.1 Kdo domain containing protein [Flavobacteriaceae bacterium]